MDLGSRVGGGPYSGLRLCVRQARPKVALASPSSIRHDTKDSMGRDRHHHYQALDLAPKGRGG
jgi:hypothetical protein